MPPENGTGEITDEDSGDEDGGGVLKNLSGSMLQAQVVINDLNGEVEEDTKQKLNRNKNSEKMSMKENG